MFNDGYWAPGGRLFTPTHLSGISLKKLCRGTGFDVITRHDNMVAW